MQSSSLPPTQAQVTAQVERLTLRLFFGTGLAASVIGGLSFALMPLQLSAVSRASLLGACAMLALVFGTAALGMRRIGLPVATRLAGWATMLVVVLISLLTREGLHAPTLALFAVVICVSCITAGLRTGVAMTAFGVVAIGGLAWAEIANRLSTGTAIVIPSIATAAAAAAPEATTAATHGPLALLVVTQLLMLAAGMAGGALISRVTTVYMRAAHERERRFGGLLRIAADWYWEMDHDFRFTHLAESSPGASLVGAETRLGATPWDILNFGIDAAAMDAHRSDLEAHRPFRGVLVRRRDAQGRQRYSRVSGQPRFDERGVFAGYWGVGRDTTPEVTAQISVAASEARYRDLFNRMPSALVLHRDGLIVDANPAAVALLGYAALADMTGQELRRHFPDPEAAEQWTRRTRQLDAMRVGDGLDATPLRMATADGRTRFVQGSPVKIDTAEGPAVLSIFHDETEQRMADAALRRSQSLLSHLVESSPDSITLCELESGRYVMVNEAFVRWFGFSADETIGRTSAELGIWAYEQERATLIDTIRRQGRVDNFPAVFLDKRQARIRVMVSGACFEEDGEAYIVLASRDITDAERTRLEHQAILQSAGIGIAFTRDERFLHTNPHFERIFGWPEGSLAGERGSVIWPSMREYEEVGGLAGPLLSAAKPVELERPMRRLDGTIFWCRLLAKVVDPRAPAQGGTIWIAEDATERRRVDQALANARDDAEAANRAKSAFLANTSHEIRTPLNGLLGMAQLALNDRLDDGRRRQYIAQIHDSAQSLAGIISDILDFSKIEAGKFTLESLPFNLREMLQAVYRAYLPLAEQKGLTLALAMSDDLPDVVRGDALRVRQIVTNYVSNAIKFTSRGGVRIDATRQEGDYTRLAISDSGPGIDATTVQRLFTPFTQGDGSTTRRHGGTGLGLSICRQLAQLMHGDVGVSSDPGHGSTFWADLPLAEALESPDSIGDRTSADTLRIDHGDSSKVTSATWHGGTGLASSSDAPARDASSFDAPARDASSFDALARDPSAFDALARDASSFDAPARDGSSFDTPAKDEPSRSIPAAAPRTGGAFEAEAGPSHARFGTPFGTPLGTQAGTGVPVAAAAEARADPLEVLRGARILIAEDNPVNMMITVAMLEQWGIQTTQAVDGAAAVEAAMDVAHRGGPFDLVLMDVQMPRMSGHEAARVLRSTFDARQLPIIALTAAALVSERDQAIASGMNDFLTKPIDANRLRQTLAHHLSQRIEARNGMRRDDQHGLGPAARGTG